MRKPNSRKSFLHLDPDIAAEIYVDLSEKNEGSNEFAIEKDVWLCRVLQALFDMPDRLPMAFKGGTSLSKVFGAIKRFSEDVDITLDYRGLDSSINPFEDGVSQRQLKKISENLKSFVREHVHHVIKPYLQDDLAKEFGSDSFRLEVSEDGEKLKLYYPTVLSEKCDYLVDHILIEFGGRNITEPNEEHLVQPDIAASFPEFDFPGSKVSVLSPSRTFWEKATLMHVECQRTEFRTTSERLSRHWYDLAMLADQPCGHAAVADRVLLADVVKHKKVFYHTGHSNYDACLTGELKLIPDNKEAIAALRNDYQSMIDAKMFIGAPPSFDSIIDRLRDLEMEINSPAYQGLQHEIK